MDATALANKAFLVLVMLNILLHLTNWTEVKPYNSNDQALISAH